MSIVVVIIADDLTGALDTAAPFLAHGHRVAVAIGPEHLDKALSSGASVVAVNTASRELSSRGAFTVVAECAKRMARVRPHIVFKKVDSRLKGNIAPEIVAAMRGFNRTRIVVAPAVPEQGRTVGGGLISGKGIDQPIDIAGRLGEIAGAAEIADCADQKALETIAAGILAEPEKIAVGARGLGQALARVLPGGGDHPPQIYHRRLPIMAAVGSEDPITILQIERLREVIPGLIIETAPEGELGPAPRGPTFDKRVIRCTTAGRKLETKGVFLTRFAKGIAHRVIAKPPETLLLSGGDTACAVLMEFGAEVLFPLGEAAFAVPFFHLRTSLGAKILTLTKSGGYGEPDTLGQIFGRDDSETGAAEGAFP